MKLIGNSNEIVTFRPKRKTFHNLCEDIVLVAEIEMKDQEKYELSYGNQLIPIATKLASQEQHKIVICTPPIYGNIDFQIILITMNYHISIGAFIQFYINQKTIYEEFRKFPKIGIDYFGDYSKFEMGGLEIVNQDCLNRFRTASEFIAFLDHDNLFIPKNGNILPVQFTEIYASYRFNTVGM
ncbi:unnamed protein product [Caenorhabditis angaria]|uniref:Glycosyltransferase family 92 protein n=1 Tax=Caenorhabditis angaria TaxID=860376 RepID=A0A9P1MVQ3_9PELO|nr:unnamed protein product [Caenorhabditis angaria]